MPAAFPPTVHAGDLRGLLRGVRKHSASCPTFHGGGESGRGRGLGAGSKCLWLGLCSLREVTELRWTLRRPMPRPLFLAWYPQFQMLTWSQPGPSACEKWEACVPLSTDFAHSRHSITICAIILLSSLLHLTLARGGICRCVTRLPQCGLFPSKRKEDGLIDPLKQVLPEPAHSASCCSGPRGEVVISTLLSGSTVARGQSLQTSVTFICEKCFKEETRVGGGALTYRCGQGGPYW